MRLSAIVVADPVIDAAELIAMQCRRLALERFAVSSAAETVDNIAKVKPQIAVFSLELVDQKPERLVKQLTKLHPELLLIATFRELSVPRMNKLGRLGVDQFVAQPVDTATIFRAAARRFNTTCRRHDRFNVGLDISRADGVVVGRTINISEGGLAMEAHHPMTVDSSVLVNVEIPADRPIRVRLHILELQGEPPQRTLVRAQFENLRGEEYRRLASYLATLDPDQTVPPREPATDAV